MDRLIPSDYHAFLIVAARDKADLEEVDFDWLLHEFREQFSGTFARLG